MELSQGEIIQKPKMQELSSLLMTHCFIVMFAPVKFHEYIHKVLELWPGHESGTYGQTDGRTDGRMDRRTGPTGMTLNALPLFFE